MRGYGTRYCGAKKTKYGTDYSATSNSKELHYILSKMMIRRQKVDVLHQLPEKLRSKVVVECDEKIVQEINNKIAPYKERAKKDANHFLNKGKEFCMIEANNNVNEINQEGNSNSSSKDFKKNEENKENQENKDNLEKEFKDPAYFQKCYSLTGRAKLKGIIAYLQDKLSLDRKMLVFVHS